MAYVPLSKDVPKIYVPSLSATHVRTPQIYVPHIEVPGKGSYKLPERKHVKDLGDLILGDPVQGTKQLKHTLRDAGYEEWINVPLLNRLVGLSVMSKERFIDPAKEGEYGTVFINALETFGNSLDTLANPVKALMPWAGGGSSTDVLKSMGWIEDEYRETYQWDTGNWLVDLVGEILSDPVTLASWGSSALMKKGANTLDDVAEKIIKESTDNVISKRTAYNLAEEFVTHTTDDSTRIIENYMTAQRNQLDDLYKQLKKANLTNSQRRSLIRQSTALQDEVDEIGYLLDTLSLEQRIALFERKGLINSELDLVDLEHGYKNLSIKQREKIIQNLVDARQARGLKTYSFWRSVNSSARSLDDLITKASLYTTLPFGLAKIVYDLGAKPLFRAMWNKAVLALKDADLTKALDNNTGKIRNIKTELIRNVNAAYKRTIEDWDEFLKQHDYSVEKARRLWLETYRNMSDTVDDLNKINTKFIQTLIEQAPELRYVEDAAKQLSDRILPEAIDSDIYNTLAKQLSFEELTDYCSTAGVINYYVESQAIAAVRSILEKDIKTFWTNRKINPKVIPESKKFTELDPIDVLHYVDEKMLAHKGGLANLAKSLKSVADTDQKTYQSLLALLNYMGITIDNSKELGKMLNALKDLVNKPDEYNKLVKDIEMLLTKSKTGDLLILDAVENGKKEINKHVKRIIKKKTNNIDADLTLQRLTYAQREGWRYVDGAPLDEEGRIATEGIVKNTKKKYDIKLEGLQTNLNEILNDIDLEPGFYDALDNVFNYSGSYDFQQAFADVTVYKGQEIDLEATPGTTSSISLGQAIRSFKRSAEQFNKDLSSIDLKDLDKLMKDNLEFIDKTRALHDAIKQIQYTINKELKETQGLNTKYSTTIRNFINQLDNDLNNIRDTGIQDLNIADIKTILQSAYEENTDVVFMKISNENMASLLEDITNAELKDNKVWIALSDPASPMRKNILGLCKQLATEENTLAYVTDIKEIFSTIDTVNLYRELANTPFCSIQDVPTELLDYIQGEFFNRIYKARNCKQAEFEKTIENILERFEENLYRQKDVKNWLDLIAGDNKELSDLILQDIVDTFRYKLNTYVTGLNNIRKQNNLPTISFYKNLNTSNIVKRMRDLGAGYENIMQQILQMNQDLATNMNKINALIDMSQFITSISSDVTRQLDTTINNLIKEIIKQKDVAKVTSLLQDELRYLHGSAIATVIENGYSKIRAINKEYAKDLGILGKVVTDQMVENVYNVQGYMLKSNVNKALRVTSNATNMYTYSTISGTAFKTFVNTEELTEHNLAPVFFAKSATNEEYTMFIYNWKAGRQYIENLVLRPDPEYIRTLRSSLIDVYSKLGSDANFSTFVIPKNPREYFMGLTNKDILIWDYISSKSSYNSRIASRYTEFKYHRKLETNFSAKAKYHMNPLSIVSEYENGTDAVTDAEHITSILQKTNLEHLDLQVDCIEADYRKNLKDLDSLSVYRNDIVNAINQDVDAMSQIARLQKLNTDERFVKDVYGIDVKQLDERTKKNLLSFGIDLNKIKMNDKRIFNYLKAEICWDQYESIKKFDAKQLRSYIDHESSGELFISNPVYDKNFDWTKKFDNKALAEAGIKIWQDPDDLSHFIIRRTDNNITDVPYIFIRHKSLFKNQRTTCLQIINKTKSYYYNDGMRLPYELYTGDMLSGNAVTILKKSDKYKTIFGDLEEQKLYSNYDKNNISKFFEKNMPRPNAMFIGDPNCYNDFMGTVADAYKSTEDVFIPKTMDLPTSISTGVIQATKMVNTQHKLLSLVANDDFYIGNSVFRPAFEKAKDEEIKAFFKDNNFVACVVKQNSKGEPRVYKIHITNHKELASAIKGKALVLPYEIYRTLVLGINKGQTQSKILNIYTRYIVGTYKSIWLSTPGFVMRNALDSMLYKNLSSTTGATNLIEVLQYEYKASKLLDWYDDIYKKAIKLREDAGGFATPNMQYIRKVLKEMPDEDKQMFLLMLSFERSGGAAGLTETVEKALLKYNKAMANGVDTVEDTIVDLLYKASPTSWINKVNDRIERVARLGLLLNLMDNGVSKTDAFRRVIDTHFDYKLTEAELGFIGQVFWFITFPIKNSLYYLNEGLTRNPDMLKVQMDAMEQSWNSGDITWDDVRHSNYLMYNAMAGNIRFTYNGKNIILKTGSSVLDFFKVLYNPVGALSERLNPFLSVLLGLEDTSQLNPLSSVSSRIDQIRQGRSLIPSVYTTLYDRNYKKRTYIERAPYIPKSKWLLKPRKNYFKKPDNMKRMRYKFATDRYYFNRGKNLHRWLSSTTSIEPHWYMNNYRYRRTQGKYNRAVKQLKRIR